jgi:hypothetical protein
MLGPAEVVVVLDTVLEVADEVGVGVTADEVEIVPLPKMYMFKRLGPPQYSV